MLYDILGPFGFYLMGIAALISTLIAMNAALSSAVNVLQALARDNYAPKKLTKLKENTDLPINSLIVTTIIALIFTYLAIIYANVGFTAEITSFIYFIGLAFVNLAAVSLRYKRKELARPFKAPFFPYLPIIVASTCLILAFTLEPYAFILGSIIFVIAITYYILTIADRYSIVITMAGIKFFAILIVGTFIWILNNLSIISSPNPGFEITFTKVLLRILIVICIFAICTVVLDVFPLKEFVYFFIKRIDKERVAIDIGIGQIIQLDNKRIKAIYGTNLVIAFIQIISAGFIFYLVYLFGMKLIIIEKITFGSIVISQTHSNYFFMASLLSLGFCIFISGILLLYLNQE